MTAFLYCDQFKFPTVSCSLLGRKNECLRIFYFDETDTKCLQEFLDQEVCMCVYVRCVFCVCV